MPPIVAPFAVVDVETTGLRFDRDQILQHPKSDYTRRLIAAVPVPNPAEQRIRREARLATK